MSTRVSVINPATEAEFTSFMPLPLAELRESCAAARRAQVAWAQVPLRERCELVARFCDSFERQSESIAGDLTAQMGKPITQARAEVRGTLARARSLVEQADLALSPRRPEPITGYDRYVERIPQGVVLNMAAWNYPLLIAVNVVVPAVLAGNAVLIKHSARTPLAGDIFATTFMGIGGPVGLVQSVQATHKVMAEFIAGQGGPDYVAFTGSVAGGRAVARAARERFIGVGLELGGKDGAYVMAEQDDLSWVAANLAEGFTYNCGQSCCAVERIYVHEKVYDSFCQEFLKHASNWRPADPSLPESNLGPLVSSAARDHILSQARSARDAGGAVLLEGGPLSVGGKGYFYAPEVFAMSSNDAALMREENFGPIVGLVKVSSDEQGVALVNDSAFGLTASVWGTDSETARRVVSQMSAGTVFLNRADYLDPQLPWTGYRDSGMGSTLGLEGFWNLTKPRSIHLRLKQG